MKQLFVTENVVKRFANHTALRQVSISVPEGRIFGLLGPNGAGKTTLIRIINQITAPDEGALFFDGEPLKAHHIENVGYLPEERGLYKKMKVGEQALYLAQLKGLPRNTAMEELKRWFRKFDIIDWWGRKVEELSKGMQQKVQFIITIVHRPRLLIFDEPFSGFDPINANLLKKEILQLKAEGATIIFSTHNMESVEELCDHIALINRSEKILDGPTNAIREQYKENVFLVDFTGQMNDIQPLFEQQFKLIDHKEQEGRQKIRVQLSETQTPNMLIAALLAKKAEIMAFNEKIPSMNDVFIRAVEENQPKQKAEAGS